MALVKTERCLRKYIGDVSKLSANICKEQL